MFYYLCKMKTLQLKNGKIVLIDESDHELIRNYQWYYWRNKTCEYVKTKGLHEGEIKWFYMHQLIMGTIGTKYEIDHKDRNGLNNMRSNLSIATRSDNTKNRRKHRGASQYNGVSQHLYGRWLARININGKQKHLGLFSNEVDAAKAYNEAAIGTGNTFYQLNDV